MANDFSNDANCCALWRFENGALTTDSKGSNTLTNRNGVTANTSDYKEGGASANIVRASDQQLWIADASLDSSFALKSGDTNKKVSICGWCNPTTISGDSHGVCGKCDTGTPAMSVRPFYLTSGGAYSCDIGKASDPSSAEVLYSSGTAQTGRWYHFGFTYQDSDKSWQFVVWDATAASKVVDTSGNSTNAIYVGGAQFVIGAGASFVGIDYVWKWDGLADEIVVFKDILTLAEIDQIRQGTYGPVGIPMVLDDAFDIEREWGG